MKKRLNIIFFGIFFMASLLAEAYCLQVLKGEIINTVGIGIVVLISAYLLMDSIRGSIKSGLENTRFYTDRILREETERWNERYTELINLHKATYTATKKNTAIMSEQVKEVLSNLETMEINHLNEFHRIIELQKKSMEGQKNILNMEIHYNKENTKQIIDVLREEGNKPELGEQLSMILKLLEANNELINDGMQKLSSMRQERVYRTETDQDLYDTNREADHHEYFAEDNDFTEDYNIDNYIGSENNYVEDEFETKGNDREEDAFAAEDEIKAVNEYSIEDDDPTVDATISDVIGAEEVSHVVTGIRAEEDVKAEDISSIEADLNAEDFLVDDFNTKEVTNTEEDFNPDDIIVDDFNTEDVTNAEEDFKAEDNSVANNNSEDISDTEADLKLNNSLEAEEVDKQEELLQAEDAFGKEGEPETEYDLKEEDIPGLQSSSEEPGFNAFYSGDNSNNNVAVKPLYDDPNKALTADEIAALFASFGQ